MTNLRVTDKVGLGRLIIDAAKADTDERKALREQLIADASAVLEGLVDIPAGHRVKAIPADDNVTLLMIPTGGDINAGLGDVAAGRFQYAAEYRPGDPAYIDPVADAGRAFEFFVGDYILKNCK